MQQNNSKLSLRHICKALYELMLYSCWILIAIVTGYALFAFITIIFSFVIMFLKALGEI